MIHENFNALDDSIKAAEVALSNLNAGFKETSTSDKFPRKSEKKLLRDVEAKMENMWGIIHALKNEIKKDVYGSSDILHMQTELNKKVIIARDIKRRFVESIAKFSKDQRMYIKGIINPLIKKADTAVDRLHYAVENIGFLELGGSQQVKDLYIEALNATHKMVMAMLEVENVAFALIGTSHTMFLKNKRKHVYELNRYVADVGEMINNSYESRIKQKGRAW